MCLISLVKVKIGVNVVSDNTTKIIQLISSKINTNEIFKYIVEMDEDLDPDELAIALVSV